MPASPSLAPVSPASRPHVLRKQGYDVSVYDRQRYPAMETSYANGGQLSASNAEVWNSAATVLKGLRWLQQRAAAAQSALQLAQVFAAAIHAPDPQPPPQHHRHHPAGDRAPAPVRHGRGRRHRLRPGAARHPHIYHDAASFEAARRGNELLREGGLERYAVTPEEVATSSRRCKRPATPDIPARHKFTRGLAQAGERRARRRRRRRRDRGRRHGLRAGWATASAWPAPPSSTATTWTSAPNACSRWWTGPAATSPASGRRAWCPGAGCAR